MRPLDHFHNPGLDGIHGTAAHSRPSGQVPLHAMTRAAVFLPLLIFGTGLGPPFCNILPWRMAFVGLLAPGSFSQFHCHPFYVKKKAKKTQGRGGRVPPTAPPPLDPPP